MMTHVHRVIPASFHKRGTEVPEDFSKVFTVEVNGEKGWEVVGTYNTWYAAFERFQKELGMGLEPVRLTSPTDTSIYS